MGRNSKISASGGTFFADPFLAVAGFFVVVLAVVVFLVVEDIFLTGSFFAAEVYFLVVVDGLAAGLAVVLALEVPAGRPAGFFAAVGFVAAGLGFATGLATAGLLEAGLVFLKKENKRYVNQHMARQTSLAASTRACGASLTLPEGPQQVS